MSEPAVEPWTPFLFGKLPSHGDFVARGLTASAEAAWDAWASLSLARAREALGETFEDAHDTAPALLFVCGPTSRAQGWSSGAVAASVDSVGRRFVVVTGVQGLSAKEAMFLGARIAEDGETAIRSALLDRLDADSAINGLTREFPETLRVAAGVLNVDVPIFGLWWRTQGADIHHGLDPPTLVGPFHNDGAGTETPSP